MRDESLHPISQALPLLLSAGAAALVGYQLGRLARRARSAPILAIASAADDTDPTELRNAALTYRPIGAPTERASFQWSAFTPACRARVSNWSPEEKYCLRSRVITSARRWETHGVWRTIFRMWTLKLLYFAGVSPVRLKQFYADTR